MRDESKLLKTDIFFSQLPISAAGTNVPELCDWLLLYPAALGVFCFKYGGWGEDSLLLNVVAISLSYVVFAV